MNWKPWLYSLILLAAPAAFGQTAQVIQLTPDEAKQAAALYAEKNAVEAKIEALRKSISAAHIHPQSRENDVFIFYDPTWVLGFVYSTDFKFIVPAPFVTQPYSGCPVYNLGIPPIGGTYLNFTNPIATPLYDTK